MKDADRIASFLPAFCESFSVADAEKVVSISVAQQNFAMNCGGSLIKLRRDSAVPTEQKKDQPK